MNFVILSTALNFSSLAVFLLKCMKIDYDQQSLRHFSKQLLKIKKFYHVSDNNFRFVLIQISELKLC